MSRALLPPALPPAAVPRFLTAHPEFREVDPTLIMAMLEQASARIDPAVWGPLTGAAIGWKAASMLDRSPLGFGTRLEPGEKSTYDLECERMEAELCVGFQVSGGLGSFGPGR